MRDDAEATTRFLMLIGLTMIASEGDPCHMQGPLSGGRAAEAAGAGPRERNYASTAGALRRSASILDGRQARASRRWRPEIRKGRIAMAERKAISNAQQIAVLARLKSRDPGAFAASSQETKWAATGCLREPWGVHRARHLGNELLMTIDQMSLLISLMLSIEVWIRPISFSSSASILPYFTSSLPSTIRINCVLPCDPFSSNE